VRTGRGRQPLFLHVLPEDDVLGTVVLGAHCIITVGVDGEANKPVTDTSSSKEPA